MKSNTVKVIGIISLIILLLGGCGYINFKIWRLQHPNAPTWTYFLKGKH